MLLLTPAPASPAGSVRVATYHVGLTRDGPGLLLRDILRGQDSRIGAVINVIAAADPDILLLQKFDYDHDLVALDAFADRLGRRGAVYPHRFALLPNTGMATGLDIDGDGRRGGPGDAQGFGNFAGQAGMAILSRLPILGKDVRDFSDILWRDLAGAGGQALPVAPEVAGVLRLSSVAHWDVPVALPGGGRLHLLTWHGSPPVFDGPEDRNGRRGAAEALFWSRYLEGGLPHPPPEGPVVVIGVANIDPLDGEGRHGAIRHLLDHPRLQDTAPRSAGGAVAAEAQGGVNAGHRGDPALDTADWPDGTGAPGNLRVSYILPGRGLKVLASGVLWPDGGAFGETVIAASRHRLVWVDLVLPE